MTAFAPGELKLDPTQNNALGLVKHAGVWWGAANALLKTSKDKLHPGMDYAPPIYFLALQCLECTLKGYLQAVGMTEKELRHDFGHRLVPLLNKAVELGLDRLVDVTPKMRGRISMMAKDYGDKEMQYFMGSRGAKGVMPAELIDDVARIHDAVSKKFPDYPANASAAMTR